VGHLPIREEIGGSRVLLGHFGGHLGAPQPQFLVFQSQGLKHLGVVRGLLGDWVHRFGIGVGVVGVGEVIQGPDALRDEVGGLLQLRVLVPKEFVECAEVGSNHIPMEGLGLEGEGKGAMKEGLEDIHGGLGEVRGM